MPGLNEAPVEILVSDLVLTEIRLLSLRDSGQDQQENKYYGEQFLHDSVTHIRIAGTCQGRCRAFPGLSSLSVMVKRAWGDP